MSSGIGRAAAGASLGTLASRFLGLVRNLVLTAAIGTSLVGDAYAVADNVPNMIFLLLGGGTIAAVFVPQLVSHSSHSDERAEQYGSLLLISAAVFGAVVSVLVIVSGPLLFSAVGGQAWGAGQLSLAHALLLWCAPQVFFLAIYWVVAQILNSRGRFSSVTWLPAVSSVVVIAGCVVLLLTATIDPADPDSLSRVDIAVLGGATLLGSAVQTVVLLLVLLSHGFRFRLRIPIRGMGLRLTATVAAWVTVSAVLYQASNLVALAAASQAGATAQEIGEEGRGYTALFYAQSLILVVSAIVVASLSTVLLQRLSQHYAAGDTQSAAADLREVMLRSASVTVPIAGMLLASGPLVGEVLFARGNTTVEAARFIGVVLSVLSWGLLPNGLHNIMLRPFFATKDGLSPFLSAARVAVIWISLSVISAVVLPAEWVVVGIAVGYVTAYIVELPFKLGRLRSKFQFRMHSEEWRTLVRLNLAAGAAALVAGGALWAVEPFVAHVLLWQLLLLAGFGVVFALTYHGLTRRSGYSLLDLVRWVRRKEKES
ncbi:murein biosynthesis integral membrane protein MurJ [Schumannella luteola]